MKLFRLTHCSALIAAAATLAGCGLSTGKEGSLTINSQAVGGTPQGSGYRLQKQREVTNFHAVENQAVCNILITVGQPFNVVVEADENVMTQVKTEVKDGVLSINMDRSINSNPPVRLLISMPKLDKITNAGVSEITASGLNEPFLTILEGGAGSITTTGSADMVDLTLSGVAKANLKDLKAKAVTALLSGTGSGEVTASQSLTATLSGLGSLKYAGHPPKVQKKVTGLGSITAE